MTRIEDIFGKFTKDDLQSFLRFLGERTKLTETKKGLATRIEGIIRNSPLVWLNSLPEYDLRLLKKLSDEGPGKKILVFRSDYPSLVEALGIVCHDREAGYDTVELSFPEGMYGIVAPHIRRVISQKEKNGDFELERKVMGYMNIYGMVPVRQFVTFFDDPVALARCPLVKLYQEFVGGESYLISPFVEDVEEVIEAREDTFPDIRSFDLSYNDVEALGAGVDAPFCAYGLDTPEGRALRDMLEDLGFSGDELSEALHNVWMDSQYATDDESTSLLFSVVTDRQDEIGSFELFREYIEVIVAYANAVPKWFLKGHSSNDADCMRITLRVDDLAQEYNNEGPGLNLYKLGLAVQHVAPDDPCPCGSGLSYRFCHGKILN